MKKSVFVMICAMVFMLGLGACTKPPVTPPPEDDSGLSFPKRAPLTTGQKWTEGDVKYPSALWTEVPAYAEDDALIPLEDGLEAVTGIFYDSPIAWNGKKTKIAAYYGFPKGASAEKKVPGIVLVHGGLGTAYPDWVKLWNDQGFAAIAMDTEGGQPLPDITMNTGKHNERNQYAYTASSPDPDFTAGPTNTGYAHADGPLEGQWMYHATSAVILANTLLRSFPQVDETRVGVTGISWGGIISSIVAGYDDRFAFCMPVYGSVGLTGTGNGNDFGTVHDGSDNPAKARALWDTTAPIEASDMPILWLNSNKDYAFPLKAMSDNYLKSKYASFTVKNSLSHGQTQGADIGELFCFARAVAGIDAQWVQITQDPTPETPVIKWRAGKDSTVERVNVYYTTAAKADKDAVYQSETFLPDADGGATVTYPENATFCYVSVVFNNNLYVSSALAKM
ncbi:hypothetical protein FACS1894211_10740 [Clostridia bacterium]|nr:hypothetical protein FACS1894211_10740 [Clostridia bacterium]